MYALSYACRGCRSTFPRELYRGVKDPGLPASELLQEAVKAELRRLRLLEATDQYLDELVDEVGEPTPDDVARAERIARQLRERAERVAG